KRLTTTMKGCGTLLRSLSPSQELQNVRANQPRELPLSPRFATDENRSFPQTKRDPAQGSPMFRARSKPRAISGKFGRRGGPHGAQQVRGGAPQEAFLPVTTNPGKSGPDNGGRPEETARIAAVLPNSTDCESLMLQQVLMQGKSLRII